MRAFVIGQSALVACCAVAEAQSAPHWSLEEDVRIGAVDDPRYALMAIGDVRIGPAGETFVVQNMANHVLVFDSGGQRSHVIGRRGGGPGEFTGKVELTWLNGDTLAAFDLDQQRYSLFLADGTHVRTGRILPEGSLGVVVLRRLLHDGTAIGYPRTTDGSERTPLLRFGSNGSLLDTLATVRFGSTESEAILDDGRRIRFTRPSVFQQGDLYALDPTGTSIVIVERPPAESTEPHRFTVTRVVLTGDTVFKGSYRYTPRPLNPERVREAQASLREWLGQVKLGGRGFTREDLDRMMAALEPPAFLAPVSGLVVARDGTIWLRREDLGHERVGWVILDVDGSRLALMESAADLAVRAAGREKLWGVIKDDLEVPYLVRYRVRKP